MLREDFSYWLTVAASNAKLDTATADAVSADVLAKMDLHESDRHPTELHFEVDPTKGTTEEVTNMCDEMREISKKYPDLVFSIRETGETDKSRQHALRIKGGKTLFENHARVVEADILWDDVTVDAIVAAIRDDFHQNELAHFIKTRFRNTPWRY